MVDLRGEWLYNIGIMTEGQRDYLADLALRKGVVLEDTDNKSVAWASKKIDELKAMDDAEFLEPTPEFSEKVTAAVDNIIKGIQLWTFQK